MIEIIGVRFKRVGKIYYFDPEGKKYAAGDNVIVETARGVEMGEVALANRLVEEESVVMPLRPIIRRATDKDFEKLIENRKKEKKPLIFA